MQAGPNPYYNTASISEPEFFFNRSAEVEVLLNSLLSGPPQCLAIVGQRKIGKTSLLQHMIRPGTMEKHGFLASSHIFLYFDCQKYPHALKSADAFFQNLLNQLLAKLPESLRNTSLRLSLETDGCYVGQEWELVLRHLAKMETNVITIFDEFDKAIAQESLIREGLFGSLRGYAQDNSNYAWITCTNRLLHDLFEEAFDEFGISRVQRKSESDFYNIAPAHIVGLFEQQDTLELINSPAKARGITFASKDVDVIMRFGGNFPYFVQRACYHVFNAHHSCTIQHEAILRKCVRESAQLWDHYWNRLDAGKQKALFAIASGRSAEVSHHEFEALKDAALASEDGQGVRGVFSEEFGQFVRAKAPDTQRDRDVLVSTPVLPEATADEIIAKGESARLEFKATLRYNLYSKQRDKEMEYAVVKTIVGFMNKEGGTLIIGVDDEGKAFGLEADFSTLRKKNIDGFQLALFDALKGYVGIEHTEHISCGFELIENKWVCIIRVRRSPEPVYISYGDRTEFWVRTGNSTRLLDVRAAIKYVKVHWTVD